MKSLKYIAAALILSSTIAACGGSDNKTIGSSQDTVAKAGTGDPGNTQAADSNKMDSVNKGNADPSGRGASDTLNARPVH